SLLVCALSGCELLKKNAEAQLLVDRRAIGLSVGSFFDQFGRPRARTEMLNASTAYAWESTVGAARPGLDSLDQRVCQLRIVADKKGTITTADIVHDSIGRTSNSRCSEIFAAP
ncbi:MAG: hypothetical protein ABI641_10580, partial [Caldimonas sp.]